MARMSISVLTYQGEDSVLVERSAQIAKKSKLGMNTITGSYAEILETVGSWAVLPEIVLFDLPEGLDVFEALNDLSEQFPEGEVELILTGVANDIMTYRKLKSMGVAEVFPDDPDTEELALAIEDIATRELRATDIDPRRVVYVWSASGGAGGTTVALAFAKHLSRQGQRTLYLDMDIFAAPASYMFAAKEGAQETYGLIEALMMPSRIDSVFLERAIQKVDKNLFYLSGRKKLGDAGFDPIAMSILVSRAQKNFDVVVVDTPWRPLPEVDWGKVNGTSFIVASPTATSYLGFSTIAKELESTPSKAPVHGIVNKAGEFKSSSFTPKMFDEATAGDVYPLAYDPAATGKLFFAQKTLLDVGGKLQKPLAKILALLPSPASESGRKNKGMFGRGRRST